MKVYLFEEYDDNGHATVYVSDHEPVGDKFELRDDGVWFAHLKTKDVYATEFDTREDAEAAKERVLTEIAEGI